MKFIINESQYKRLLSEQEVYSDKAEYDKALLRYEEAMQYKILYEKLLSSINDLFSRKITFQNHDIVRKEYDKVLNDISNKYGDLDEIGISYSLKGSYIREGCINDNTGKVYYEGPRITLNDGEFDIFTELEAKNCEGGHYIKYLIYGGYIWPEKPIYDPTMKVPKKSPKGMKGLDKNKNKMLDPTFITTNSVAVLDSGVAPFSGKIIDALKRKKNPVLTNFIIEFMWGGNRKLIYFNTYEEWSKVFNSGKRKGNSSENGSRTWAEGELYHNPAEFGL